MIESEALETTAKDKSSGLKWDSFSRSGENAMTNGESEFERLGFKDAYQTDYISAQCLLRRSGEHLEPRVLMHQGRIAARIQCHTPSSAPVPRQ